VSRPVTRREALVALGAGGAALWLAGCGGGGTRTSAGAARDGSTLLSTYADPSGDGLLHVRGGEPLVARTELAPVAARGAVLATLAHLTDAHVLDAQSPARVPFLDRLGPPFGSTFRPQETLTYAVLDGAARAVRALAPDAVIQGGDLVDNAQLNELTAGLALLRGGPVDPDSGTRGYVGVQSASDADPFYYRPDLDAPVHRGLLGAAVRPFVAAGLAAPWYPVLGDHDLLVQGVVPPSPLTEAIAVGDRALYELPVGLSGEVRGVAASDQTPDGLAAPQPIDSLLGQLLAQPSVVTVPADPRRREVSAGEMVSMLRVGSGSGGRTGGPFMNYAFDVGSAVRVIVLDLVRRAGGSGGLAQPGQAAWLAGAVASASRAGRWMLVFSHQPLASSVGGPALLAVLDRSPRVVAAIAGHTHRNRIVPRRSSGAGYWLIETASLVDYPQQSRALRLVETAGGGVALDTWMLDHVPSRLGDISRSLAFIDVHGGRPQGFAGGALDRNVVLYRG